MRLVNVTRMVPFFIRGTSRANAANVLAVKHVEFAKITSPLAAQSNIHLSDSRKVDSVPVTSSSNSKSGGCEIKKEDRNISKVGRGAGGFKGDCSSIDRLLATVDSSSLLSLTSRLTASSEIECNPSSSSMPMQLEKSNKSAAATTARPAPLPRSTNTGFALTFTFSRCFHNSITCRIVDTNVEKIISP